MTVYTVVAIWAGIIEEVETFVDLKKANRRYKSLQKKYGISEENFSYMKDQHDTHVGFFTTEA